MKNTNQIISTKKKYQPDYSSEKFVKFPEKGEGDSSSAALQLHLQLKRIHQSLVFVFHANPTQFPACPSHSHPIYMSY